MAELILERSVRLEMRAQAHHLQPGVLIGEKGLTAAVMKEIDRALSDHGLVKVHVAGDDREERAEIYLHIADQLQAARIQAIGKMLVFYRPQDEDKKPSKTETQSAILMAKADPGARGMKKPSADPKKKISGTRKASGKASAKSTKPRVTSARKRPKRTTKKAALS